MDDGSVSPMRGQAGVKRRVECPAHVFRREKMPLKTIDWVDGKMRIIDQTRLPEELVYLDCTTPEEVWQAIKRLSVRGAPAIGIAAAMGVVLGVKDSKADTYEKFLDEVKGVANYIGTSRPTAVNLFWALERMVKAVEKHGAADIVELKRVLEREAIAIMNEDNKICRDIGRHGAELIREGDAVLTHCNAGGLATAQYGTALSVVFFAHEQGKKINVFVDETRPLLQGSRLTAWELVHAGIPATLICDNMAAQVMREGRVSLVVTGADRITANGDTANKIGTYGLAQLAAIHKVPFYVAAPRSTIDRKIATGDSIPIEQRKPDEVRRMGARWIAPREVNVYNPAFDVTPSHLIHGIITEVGILRPPYKESIAAAFEKKESAHKNGTTQRKKQPEV
jgi:methylthioribose-1-phosphate isomerase